MCMPLKEKKTTTSTGMSQCCPIINNLNVASLYATTIVFLSTSTLHQTCIYRIMNVDGEENLTVIVWFLFQVTQRKQKQILGIWGENIMTSPFPMSILATPEPPGKKSIRLLYKRKPSHQSHVQCMPYQKFPPVST